MSTEIIKSENIQDIVQKAPAAYESNKKSRNNCIAYGEQLLDKINKLGMNDAIDAECAAYIKKTAATLKVMNERRSSVTQLFDLIRGEYTSLENDLDKSSKTSVPYLLQQKRNEYATFKREEEKRLQAERERQQRHAQALTDYEQQCSDNVSRKLLDYYNLRVKQLETLYEQTSLTNYNTSLAAIQKDIDAELKEYLDAMSCDDVAQSPFLEQSECSDIAGRVLCNKKAKFLPWFDQNYDLKRNYYLDRMPSKKAELEKIAAEAQKNAENAAKMQAELKAKQEAERKRIAQEEEAKRQQQAAKEAAARREAEMKNLFDQSSISLAPASKAKVQYEIILLNPEGILPVLSKWFLDEGKNMTVDELRKTFKKQISYCEKIANKNQEFIQDESVEYHEKVTAR